MTRSTFELSLEVVRNIDRPTEGSGVQLQSIAGDILKVSAELTQKSEMLRQALDSVEPAPLQVPYSSNAIELWLTQGIAASYTANDLMKALEVRIITFLEAMGTTMAGVAIRLQLAPSLAKVALDRRARALVQDSSGTIIRFRF